MLRRRWSSICVSDPVGLAERFAGGLRFACFHGLLTAEAARGYRFPVKR